MQEKNKKALFRIWNNAFLKIISLRNDYYKICQQQY